MVKGKKLVIAQLNQKLKDSGEEQIEVCAYSGGNDEGYIEYITPLVYDSEYREEDFENDLYEATGYGSFSGDYSCYGTIYWDGKMLNREGMESAYITADCHHTDFS